jgi:hypothetical protein
LSFTAGRDIKKDPGMRDDGRILNQYQRSNIIGPRRTYFRSFSHGEGDTTTVGATRLPLNIAKSRKKETRKYEMGLILLHQII